MVKAKAEARAFRGTLSKDFIAEDYPILCIQLDDGRLARNFRRKYGGLHPAIEDLVFEAASVDPNDPDPWETLNGRKVSIAVTVTPVEPEEDSHADKD